MGILSFIHLDTPAEPVTEAEETSTPEESSAKPKKAKSTTSTKQEVSDAGEDSPQL